MKGFIIFVFLILMVGTVGALSTDIKSSYAPKETIIGKVSVAILEPLQSNQVMIKRNNVNVPVEYDLKKVGEDYYIWALAPENPNNYTLWIDSVLTLVNGEQKRIDYSQNFVVSGNITDYYINPGFAIVNGTFNLKIISNVERAMEISILDNRSYEINPGENNVLLQPSASGFMLAGIGKYSMPLYVFPSEKNSTEYYVSNATTEVGLSLEPEKIDAILLANSSRQFSFVARNSGNETLKNIYLDYNRSIMTITPDVKVDLEKNESVYYNISLETKNDFVSSINLTNGSFAFSILMNVAFTNDSAQVLINYSTSENSGNGGGRRCFEIGGLVCATGKVCSVSPVDTVDGACCRAICQSESGTGVSWSWLGYVFLGLVIIGGVYIWYKYYRVKPVNVMEKKFAEAEQKVRRGP